MIGITQRLEENPSYYEIREALSCEWGEFFNDLDFLPLSYSVPFERYVEKINAVIFSGGNDLYALNPQTINKKRDAYETKIIKHCLKKKLPLLGICRGAQMIAHFFDSTLCQKNHHITPAHPIVLLEDNNEYDVNSYHNFAITKLGENLIPLALGKDGSIEAYQHNSLPIFGIMWHIEREKTQTFPSQMIWKNFLKEVKR
ncbi:hypothetical protein BKH41_04215 [Helicobacter sp. 12S02232-10]|uniref:gamma-glutamyl-CDP-amidate hydrolase n=1 Tax=Helicobacter sp. 12S02232-10 TaxID=1476197 RepID=UPI000BA5B649|nr:gamma-glutamyl-CDP-amidate hydrolase [Helicobacter sp. 12S02232-10]PAF48839.1 hypothetical protein BKH41_04215 [Helicobacter sp. 12S02232-10]